ncbi:competence type IV pilus minor pilin ComGF [Bacillaceae bacterium S4-13-56]
MGYHTNRSEKGFSLIETLLSLMITLIIMTSLPFLYRLFFSLDDLNNNQTIEVHQLFEFIYFEIKGSQKTNITSTQLLITKPSGEIVSIEKYGDIVRRRVNFTGHEPLLYSISNLRFSKPSQHELSVLIVDKKGVSYEKSYHLP